VTTIVEIFVDTASVRVLRTRATDGVGWQEASCDGARSHGVLCIDTARGCPSIQL